MKFIYWGVVISGVASFAFFKIHSQPHPTMVQLTPHKPAVPNPAVQLNPSTVIERVHLGETTLGLPFDVEVRLFDLKGSSAREVIAWHLALLDGPCEVVLCTDHRSVYIRKGVRNPNRSDTTHGFAALQGDRGLFLDCFEKEGKLYVCTAEGPLETFQQHESFLRSLCAKEMPAIAQ